MAISRVGKELYNMLIKPYTKKQWNKYPKVRIEGLTVGHLDLGTDGQTDGWTDGQGNG